MPSGILDNLSLFLVVPGFVLLYIYIRVKVVDSLIRRNIFVIITVVLSLTLAISLVNTNITNELIYLSLISLVCLIYSCFDKKPM